MVRIFVSVLLTFAAFGLAAPPASSTAVESTATSTSTEPIDTSTGGEKEESPEEKKKFVEFLNVVLEKAKEDAATSVDKQI
ncbi:hypothetical protein QQS21_000098 [Conoideocrella luteorostrata]|uniref:Secreted protein n=1 Tax=Conoideocrella luteorostrata TaxID=1105319 RepID=A0AAJ0D1J7_9HYPO|nr:hypothetical protein QQS21_000098 [Conoideocrella luteorostrata]